MSTTVGSNLILPPSPQDNIGDNGAPTRRGGQGGEDKGLARPGLLRRLPWDLQSGSH